MAHLDIIFGLISGIEFVVIVSLIVLCIGLKRKRESIPVESQSPIQIHIGGLEGCSGMYKGAVVPIESGEEMVIGRDRTMSNLIIGNPNISRKHCGIRYNESDGTYIVTDYSSNGVSDQNGERFPKNTPVVCKAGTVLVLAQSDNEFQLK